MRRLSLVLIVLALLALSCGDGDDDTSNPPSATSEEIATVAPETEEPQPEAQEPEVQEPEVQEPEVQEPEVLEIVTYNAGLAEGFVPYASARQPLVIDAVAGLDADLVFVQEVWAPQSVAALREATSTLYPDAIFPEPIPEASDAAAEPACAIEELADLEACVEMNCADVGPDELVGCVLTSCASQYDGLCAECQACIAANVGKTVEEAVSSCTLASAAFAYEGSVGIGLLSKATIIETNVEVLDSSLNRRAVVHALVDTTQFGPVHVFGTHLSAVFSDIPYPGEGTWEQEQAEQIAAVLDFIDSIAAAGEPVILLGDFNTGPAGETYQAEVSANYDLLEAASFSNAYVQQPGEACTFCGDNPLVGGGKDVVIDHVFTRDIPATAAARRILDEPISITVDGTETDTTLSDHYGVALSLGAN